MTSISISARKKARKKAKSQTALNRPAEIEHAATIMGSVKPTPFSAEGPIVENVRRNRVLAGMPFAQADESARELALAALKSLGWAVRPIDSEAAPIVTGSKLCPQCGEEFVYVFTNARDRFGAQTKFCSFECLKKKEAPYRRAQAAAHIARKRAAMAEKPCAECGGMFRPDPGHTNKEEQKYCSRNCYLEGHAKRRAPPRPCEYCGEAFQSIRRGKAAMEQKFCSSECHQRSRAERASQFRCEAA